VADEAVAILDGARVDHNAIIAQAIFDIGMNFLAVQEASPISDWTDFLAQDPGAGDWDAKMSEQRLKHHPKVILIVADVGAAEYRGFHVLRVFWVNNPLERWQRGVESAYFHLRERRFATADEFYRDDERFNQQPRDSILMPRRIACVHPR
jgi:hypothetical protein